MSIKDWSTIPNENMVKGNIIFNEGQTMGTVRPSIVSMSNELRNYQQLHSKVLNIFTKTEQINIQNLDEGSYIIYFEKSNIDKNIVILPNNIKFGPRNTYEGYYNLIVNGDIILKSLGSSSSIPTNTYILSTKELGEGWVRVKEYDSRLLGFDIVSKTVDQTVKKHRHKIVSTNPNTNNIVNVGDIFGPYKHKVRHQYGNYPLRNTDSYYHEHDLELDISNKDNPDIKNKAKRIILSLYKKL